MTAYKPHDPSNVKVKLSTSTQNLFVMEGDRVLMAVQANVGKPSAPTPHGHFTIYSKQKERRRQSDPDPPRSQMMSPSWFTDPPGPLLVDQ